MYNHNSIGDGKTPLIPNVVYKALLWLIENKFTEEAEYLKSLYTLTEYQKGVYNFINKS